MNATLNMRQNPDGSVTIRADGQNVVELMQRMQSRSNHYGAVVDALKELIDAWLAPDSPTWDDRFSAAMKRAKEESRGVK
jgi:hypothetical protein